MGSIKKTETGSVLNFNTYLPKTLDETKISFTPKQSGSGTPSPENVREIVGKNGITVWQSGKNLLNPNDADWGQYTITPTGEHTEETDRICSGYIPCNEGDTFTFSGSVRGSASYVMSFVGIAGFDKDKVYVNRNATNYVKKISYTVPNGVKYIRVFEEAPKYPNITMEIWCNTLKRQLEIGSEATAYEPFTASVETSVSFPAVGKNLFDYANGENIRIATSPTDRKKTASSYGTITNDGNTVTLTRKLEAAGLVFILGKLQAGVTYTLSGTWDNIDNKAYIALLDTDVADEYTSTRKYTISFYYNSVSFTPETTGIYEVLLWRGGRGAISASNVQLEKGSTATEYEAFNNTIYGGYVDLVDGEVVVEYACVTLDGVNVKLNTKGYSSNDFYGGGWVYTKPQGIGRVSGKEYYCDRLPYGEDNANVPHYRIPYGGVLYYMIRPLPKSDYPDGLTNEEALALTNEWLQQNPVTVAYPLLEPIHYPLSPRILTTLQGNNVMWSDGDELTISYTDDVVNTYDFRRHISLDTPHKASASGAVASFGTDMVGKMKCKIHFSPKQERSGTPSPDNVREISGRSSVKLWQSGKNLFDKASAKMGRYESVDGVWTFVENRTWYASDLIRVKPNTRYSMFCGTPLASVGAYINVYDENMARVNYTTYLSYITTTADAKYLSVHCAGTSPVYKNRDTVMICEGSDVPSEYEPYTGNEITFTFPSTVGDNGMVYGGYVDLVNGEVVEEYVYRDMTTFSSIKAPSGTSEPWNHRFSLQHWVNGVGWDRAAGVPVLCDSIQTANGSGKTNYTGDASTAVWYVYDDTISTVAEFKEKYAGHYVAYKLKPTLHMHYSLTPQAISTLRGANRIWSDGDSVEVEYYKHTDEPQEYIPAEVLGTGNIAIVTSDGYLIGEEQDYIKY